MNRGDVLFDEAARSENVQLPFLNTRGCLHRNAHDSPPVYIHKNIHRPESFSQDGTKMQKGAAEVGCRIDLGSPPRRKAPLRTEPELFYWHEDVEELNALRSDRRVPLQAGRHSCLLPVRATVPVEALAAAGLQPSVYDLYTSAT
jgi:hypothetical protein